MSTIQDKTKQIRALCDEIDAQAAGTTPPPTTRQCYFGYFGDNPTIVEETNDHVNLCMPFGWPVGNTAIDVGKKAKAAGQKIMLPVWGEGMDEAHHKWFFGQCEQAGILDAVVAIYPMDEPDVAGKTDAWVKAMLKQIRGVADGFPAIADAPMAVFYGPDGKTPGIDDYDWIGRDDYGQGPQVLPLKSNQRLMIIAGGSSPWRESPDSYVAYAQAHPEVVVMQGFMWLAPNDNTTGIKVNGMAASYRAAGKTLTGK